MGEQIRVDPAVLERPAGRFRAGADGLGQIRAAVQDAMRQAGAGAQNATVGGAVDAFGQAAGGVLEAFGAECRAMGEKLSGAGVRYRVTDETAVVVHVSDSGISGR